MLVKVMTEDVKHGRFEATVTREYYAGEEERQAQIKAFRILLKALKQFEKEDSK